MAFYISDENGNLTKYAGNITTTLIDGTYVIQVADIAGRTITLYDSEGTPLSSQATPSITGGIVTFSVDSPGEYSATSSNSDGEVWTNSVTVEDIGRHYIRVPDIYAEGENTSTTKRYAMDRYTIEELHTILQNGYFSTMFEPRSKWNYQEDSSSILYNYDFFVEQIEKQEDGSEVAYMRLAYCYTGATYQINPYFGYMSSSSAISFSGYYSSAGGYKYSNLRQKMMKAGDEVWSQATGIKPTDYTTISTGIEFDKIYYTDGEGKTSGVYTYDPSTDSFSEDNEMTYFLSTSTAATGVKFLKGYFTSVGTLTEEQFNSGYYYTYSGSSSTSNPPVYTPATEYSSSTTYYGFYETIQEDGVFYNALNAIKEYMMPTEDYSSTGLTNTTYTSLTEDYVDIPSASEMSGFYMYYEPVFSKQNSSSTTTYSNVTYQGIEDGGEQRDAYKGSHNAIYSSGSYNYWTRSPYSGHTTSFVYVSYNGSFGNIIVNNSNRVRVGFKLG